MEESNFDRRKHFKEFITWYRLREKLVSTKYTKRTSSRSEGSELDQRPSRSKVKEASGTNRWRLPHRPRPLNVNKINVKFFAAHRSAQWLHAQHVYKVKHAEAWEDESCLEEIEDEKPSPEEQWLVDRQDPDNWIVIPEFNVLPEDVMYVGFDKPIVYPGVPNFELAASLREMLRVARTKIRAVFTTQEEYFRCYVSSRDTKESELNSEQQIACSYSRLETNIRVITNYDFCDDKFRNIHHAKAHQNLIALIRDDQTVAVEHAARKEKESAAGRLSGEARKEKAISKSRLIAAAKARGWPLKRHGVNKALAREFGITHDYVGKILRAELKLMDSSRPRTHS